ncbi:hypothetical protein, partial [uncultured Actinomyces sp.]|uniref:hypothetical protein n=1 Tax=uncultured Actinomyces sp. TaxID=249061 RepID=UPI0028CFFF25
AGVVLHGLGFPFTVRRGDANAWQKYGWGACSSTNGAVLLDDVTDIPGFRGYTTTVRRCCKRRSPHHKNGKALEPPDCAYRRPRPVALDKLVENPEENRDGNSSEIVRYCIAMSFITLTSQHSRIDVIHATIRIIGQACLQHF